MAVIEAVLVEETWTIRNLEMLMILVSSIGFFLGMLLTVAVGLFFDSLRDD